ncbi:MAG TPA: hypothetical protein VLF39_01210 [Candidatus Saccharimonadales bacterium]|nr:hypothetical protein [Candidatus Saccharimonadales bacterium]
MSERNRDTQWPPAEFAVLQDGDGNPSYYRPREADEDLGTFIERIATTVVVGITSVRGTTFIEIVEGTTGETDEALTLLVVESMDKQKLARR